MAEAKKEYLYSEFKGPFGNEALKEKAGEIGATMKFDREVGAYELVTDGLTKKAITEQKKHLADFIGKEAETRWSAEREAFKAKQKDVKAAVKSREGTTSEAKPAKAVARDDGAIAMYPAISQKKAFRALLVETNSESRFQKARDGEIAHYRVKTANPDAFVEYVGAEAKARYQSEYAEHLAKGGKAIDQGVDTNTPIEKARDAARARAGGGFMAQYKDRGFLLSDSERDAGNHQRQLNDMRTASVAQLLAVVRQSRAILTDLREKELGMRAEAAGLPIEQVRGMSFADQKAIKDADGKSVGLTGDEYQKHQALSRGLSAMDVELKSRRGVGQEKASGKTQPGQDTAQDKAKASERAPARSVSEEKSADSDFEMLSAGYRARQGRGR